MNVIDTLSTELKKLLTGNELYQNYFEQWQYLLESYVGGNEYRTAGHLTRYQLETDAEYRARLKTTPLENHCASVISVYNSFLFREEPDRDFSQNGISFELEMFLRDADLDGRSFNAFMKEVAVWSSVFGHCWVLVTKPNVGALTLGEEQNAQVRPYVNLVTPLTVTDWNWHRKPNGQFELTYFKYIEESNDTFATIREWTKDSIKTYIVNNRSRAVQEESEEINGLGKIPAVLAYNHRSPVRGIGVSDISDISHAQMTIYNLTSEIEQSVRINGHPALVKTAGTEASAGAGAIVQMEDNLDPGLKPYILSVSTDINSIFNAIGHVTDAIDKMANTGSIRATESRRMSGVAQKQEFELLNAKLSEKADNLELTEEQIWQYWFEYQGQQWMGEVNYPDGFNIADTSNDIDNLVKAKGASTDPVVARVVDEMLLEALGSEKERLPYQDINPIVGRTYPDGEAIPESLPPAYMPAQDSGKQDQNCANCEYYKASEGYCTKFDANVRPVYWCAKWEPMED
jgi:hypothetical protein